ncbi:TNF receptor-associated factor 4 [Geodia barretti]|uniref:TNF receptor-associated factor 4 n=1 Tax=Geodia barretti TaxID=519541 RepID=A0AA35S901_GEOBA|nr:TNF receptor-associated factor 4 [Geodia barretti]
MAEGGYGGHEYDFVNESLDPKYYCLVCRNVLREPMLTDCCGQHYCKSCLQQCNRSSYTRRCPHCRRENYQSILDQSMQRDINQLKIYCVNRSSKNCWWRDELSKLPRHLNTCPQRENMESLEKYPSGCGKLIKMGEIEAHRETYPLEEVTCNLQGPNENNEVVTCGQGVLRLELPIHEKICPFRTFECKFCKKASTYVSITGQAHTDVKQPKKPPERGHYAECPDYPLSCKNKCRSGEIRRADMEQHLGECPLETIQCEHWEEGCNEMVRRKDMGGHMKAFKKQHQEYVRFAYLHKKKDMKI